MEFLVFLGRVLFSLLFLSAAVGHLVGSRQMAGYAAFMGVPASRAATVVGGVLLLLGGLSLLLGVWPDLGALLLVVFLVPTAFAMHPFWKKSDPITRRQTTTSFLKDISLAGAALMALGFFSLCGDDLGLTFTGPLFSAD
ncbi:DoxX family membrane protein [Streptomyces macrosporus]|uniref:DoxX family protein n=1 Tax=Streptomyces macrosporus TaxID=44032 RepID=A0ABN3JSS8_9ACTN